MKRIFFLFFFCLISSAVLAADGKVLGKVNRIDPSTGEIIVSSPTAADNIRVGDKLYVRINQEPVVIVAVFPMMTTVKCRPAPGFKSYIASLSKGAVVYSYIKDVEKNIDSKTVDANASFNELSILCGKKYDDEAVQKYMEKISGGSVSVLDSFFSNIRAFEEIKTNDGTMYTVKNRGISLNFDQARVLKEIILYAEGVSGFAQYQFPLPESLQFSDSRGDVEQKIGRAREYGGKGLLPCWAEYPYFGICVTYWTESLSDLKHCIRTISVRHASGR